MLTALIDDGFAGHVARVTSKDSFIPLGDAAGTVLLSEQAIESAARSPGPLTARRRPQDLA